MPKKISTLKEGILMTTSGSHGQKYHYNFFCQNIGYFDLFLSTLVAVNAGFTTHTLQEVDFLQIQ